MTENTKQAIRRFAKDYPADNLGSAFNNFIIGKTVWYNMFCRIEGEPEMFCDEMIELLNEKLTTYRGGSNDTDKSSSGLSI